MHAGRLRESIRFDRRSPTGQNVGGVIKADWAPLCGPFRAQKQPMRGYEQAAEMRLAGRQVFELRLRGCADIRRVTTDDRAVDDRKDVTFNILSIDNPDQVGREYVFTVEQGGSDG